MSDTWTTHGTANVGGRLVEALTYSEGGFRVITTQKGDVVSEGYRDGDAVLIPTPIPDGTRLRLDGESLDELRGQVLENGFSLDEAGEITSMFPADD